MIERERRADRNVEPLSPEERARYLLQCAGAVNSAVLKSFLLGLARDEIEKLPASDEKNKLRHEYARDLETLSQNRYPE